MPEPIFFRRKHTPEKLTHFLEYQHKSPSVPQPFAFDYVLKPQSLHLSDWKQTLFTESVADIDDTLS